MGLVQMGNAQRRQTGAGLSSLAQQAQQRADYNQRIEAQNRDDKLQLVGQVAGLATSALARGNPDKNTPAPGGGSGGVMQQGDGGGTAAPVDAHRVGKSTIGSIGHQASKFASFLSNPFSAFQAPPKGSAAAAMKSLEGMAPISPKPGVVK